MKKKKQKEQREEKRKRNKMAEIGCFTTKESVNLKDLFAKMGYSNDVFYFGETDKGESLYSIPKTTTKVGESNLQIIGDSEELIPWRNN